MVFSFWRSTKDGQRKRQKSEFYKMKIFERLSCLKCVKNLRKQKKEAKILTWKILVMKSLTKDLVIKKFTMQMLTKKTKRKWVKLGNLTLTMTLKNRLIECLYIALSSTLRTCRTQMTNKIPMGSLWVLISTLTRNQRRNDWLSRMWRRKRSRRREGRLEGRARSTRWRERRIKRRSRIRLCQWLCLKSRRIWSIYWMKSFDHADKNIFNDKEKSGKIIEFT